MFICKRVYVYERERERENRRDFLITIYVCGQWRIKRLEMSFINRLRNGDVK